MKKLKNQEDEGEETNTSIDAFLDFVLIADTVLGDDEEDEEDEEEGCEVTM